MTLPVFEGFQCIQLSVYICTVLSLVSMFYMVSSVLNIANCSACLFEQRPSNLYFFVSVTLSSLNIETPAPTPRSLLLPSVYT